VASVRSGRRWLEANWPWLLLAAILLLALVVGVVQGR